MVKTCYGCKTVKDQSEFHKDRSQKDGLNNRCKDCAWAHNRRWRLNNPERCKAAQAACRQANPNKAKAYQRLCVYGVTAADIRALKKAQNNKCAICGRKRPLQIDHCHKTGLVRMLLCWPCNTAIGAFKDSPEICEKAAALLRHPLAPSLLEHLSRQGDKSRSRDYKKR